MQYFLIWQVHVFFFRPSVTTSSPIQNMRRASLTGPFHVRGCSDTKDRSWGQWSRGPGLEGKMLSCLSWEFCTTRQQILWWKHLRDESREVSGLPRYNSTVRYSQTLVSNYSNFTPDKGKGQILSGLCIQIHWQMLDSISNYTCKIVWCKSLVYHKCFHLFQDLHVFRTKPFPVFLGWVPLHRYL